MDLLGPTPPSGIMGAWANPPPAIYRQAADLMADIRHPLFRQQDVPLNGRASMYNRWLPGTGPLADTPLNIFPQLTPARPDPKFLAGREAGVGVAGGAIEDRRGDVPPGANRFSMTRGYYYDPNTPDLQQLNKDFEDYIDHLKKDKDKHGKTANR